MRISPFLLERHFARYEFEVPFQLSCSDCEPLNLSELMEIDRFCGSLIITLFSDEMYRGLEQNPADRLPCMASLGIGNIALSGMSKSFALPGLRIGWLICRNPDKTGSGFLACTKGGKCGSAEFVHLGIAIPEPVCIFQIIWFKNLKDNLLCLSKPI